MDTWYEINCPACETGNLVNNGDCSDLTIGDVESFQCWNCKKVICVGEDDSEDSYVSDDQDSYDTQGKPVPK